MSEIERILADVPALDHADIARLVDAVFDRNIIPAVRGRDLPQSICELELLLADARQRATEQLDERLRGFVDPDDVERIIRE
jgi:hypothetical protein